MREKLGAILLRSLMWALSGALFGGLFSGLYLVFGVLGNPEWMTLTLATSLSGGVTSAFFGAMPVALLGSMIGVLVAIAHQMIGLATEWPLFMLGVALGVGLLAGSFYSGRTAMRFRPLGQTVSGLLAGFLAGPLLFLVAEVVDAVNDPMWRAAVAVSLVGILFIILSGLVLALCSEWVSTRMSGPVVAGVVALAVAASIWLMVSSLSGAIALPALASGGSALSQVATGLVGGALGGAFGGAVLEILGIERAEYRV